MQKPSFITRSVFFVLLVGLVACQKEDDGLEIDLPGYYNFENVTYERPTQHLAMFSEMKNYMALSQLEGGVLDADRLNAMYANNADQAQWQGEYEASNQMKDHTFAGVQADFEGLFEELALASQSTVEGEEGQAGRITSLDGAKTYLVGADGLDHAQIIEKGLMGACLYHQAVEVYMGAEKMAADNTNVVEGVGTQMEYHWDQAFGYLGVPRQFPTDVEPLYFWGSYAQKRDGVLGCNEFVMEALIKGRYGISQKDLSLRDEAISETRTEWERIGAGSAIHYLNEALIGFEDMAIRSHAGSEAIGFIYGLQLNPESRITSNQVNELLELVAGSSHFAEMNLYQVTIDDLEQAKELLSGYYDMTDIKDIL